MTSCLVTGGAGFIGSSIARVLLRRGDRVRILDDFSTGKRANLDGMAGPIELIEASILDEAAGLMDDIQDGLAQVAGLANLLSGAADFGNPTTRLPSMLTSFTDAAGGASGAVSGIGSLL